jgi:hypothetical protein
VYVPNLRTVLKGFRIDWGKQTPRHHNSAGFAIFQTMDNPQKRTQGLAKSFTSIVAPLAGFGAPQAACHPCEALLMA